MRGRKKNFRERTQWPIWLWIFLLFLAASLSLALWAALGVRWASITGALEILGLLIISQRSLLEIVVTERELRVGSATIERQFIGAVEFLSAQEMRQWRGPRADPAAFMALRFWIATGVRFEVKDSRDPTPYWLISSKKAQRFATALMHER